MASKEADVTMTIAGKTYPVDGYVKAPNLDGVVPIVGMKMMSDYRWQLNSLMSRINNPEVYRENLGEDVDAVIAKLTSWVTEHIDEADNLRDGERTFLTMLIGKEAAV